MPPNYLDVKDMYLISNEYKTIYHILSPLFSPQLVGTIDGFI